MKQSKQSAKLKTQKSLCSCHMENVTDVQKLSSLVRMGTEFVLYQRCMSFKATMYGLFCKAI